ncbi:phage terminase large subunit family protein [Lentisphaerota bacterium ZTH]|nr:phage terminase large subunit family protein [Lentisphaerota bacterium]WET07477.1 phage terminase large subunit family protein [Lentisphaerota bacterium ZTH]
MESISRGLYQESVHRIIDSRLRVVAGSLSVKHKVSPAAWAEGNVDFKHVVSARIRSKLDLNLTPYLRAPIDAWDFAGTRREVTVCAPEQTGKTLAWVCGLLWTFIFQQCLSLVCYESDDKAAEINTDKFKPLMEGIPELAAELAVPKAVRADRYKFSQLSSFFQGSERRITSKSAKINVADELDDWIDHAATVDNLEDMRKRTRSFAESILYKVCTIKGSDRDSAAGTKSSKIWQEFKSSSMGFWYLKCQNPKCPSLQGEHPGLTMRSADIHNLQFDLDAEKRLISGTARLVCPTCGFEHPETMKRAMNLQGGYIHRHPERLQGKSPHYGFQWGVLGSQFEAFAWDKVAAIQLEAGHTGDLKKQILFDNSWRGLPFKERKANSQQVDAIRSHCSTKLPESDTIEAVFLSADTQDYGWKWEIRALDINCNRWQLAYGFCEFLEFTAEERDKHNSRRKLAAEHEGGEFVPVETLEDVLYKEYLGIQPILGIIDEGGHRGYEVRNFVAKHRRLYTYKGDSRGSQKFCLSKNYPKLILARKKEYQAHLLHYIYTQNNRDNFYWYLLPEQEVSQEYVRELSAMRPDSSNKKEGHMYENYVHNSRVHDYFDTSKMYLVIEDFAIAYLAKSCWQQKKAECLNIPKSSPKKAEASLTPIKSNWMKGFNL